MHNVILKLPLKQPEIAPLPCYQVKSGVHMYEAGVFLLKVLIKGYSLLE